MFFFTFFTWVVLCAGPTSSLKVYVFLAGYEDLLPDCGDAVYPVPDLPHCPSML